MWFVWWLIRLMICYLHSCSDCGCSLSVGLDKRPEVWALQEPGEADHRTHADACRVWRQNDEQSHRGTETTKQQNCGSSRWRSFLNGSNAMSATQTLVLAVRCGVQSRMMHSVWVWVYGGFYRPKPEVFATVFKYVFVRLPDHLSFLNTIKKLT